MGRLCPLLGARDLCGSLLRMARYIVVFRAPHVSLGPFVGTKFITTFLGETCSFKVVGLVDTSAVRIESLYRRSIVAAMVRRWAKLQQTLGIMGVLMVIGTGQQGRN